MTSDKVRFKKVLDEHQGILINLCSIYYDNPSDQQDAFQDIALQLWMSFNRFKGESKMSTWIYKVCINTLLSKRRKEKRRSLNTTSLDNAMMVQSQGQWTGDDDYQVLMRLFAVLNDTDKAILILYLEGYSNKEIAVTLSTSQTNISTRINRAKLTLKGKVNQNKAWRLKI